MTTESDARGARLPKMLPPLDVPQRRPGFGIRHPDLLDLLDRVEPVTVEQIVWPGDMRLEVAAYIGATDLPDEIVTSVRCIVCVGNEIVLCHAPDETHVWPGGRRVPGESHATTLCREVHEETGWIIDPADLRLLGFLHYRMLDAQPDSHPYPHPDFLQLVYTASTSTRDGGRGEWSDLDGWELGSTLASREELAAVDLSAAQRALLRALDR